MSRLRQTKISSPSNPPANTEELYYDSASPGYNTPPALMSRDESGNKALLATYAVPSYRFLKVSENKTAGAGTWTPANGCQLAVVECIGAGGSGGGAATSSTQVSVGGGGGGGAYAMKTLTGAAIKSTSYSIGTKGAAQGAGAVGVSGGDTTWDTTVIVAKGGAGGGVLAAGTTSIHQLGGAGGLASGSTGDYTRDGSVGGSGIRFNTVLGIGGAGAAGAFGVHGAGGVSSPAGGTAGISANAAAPGAGGGGAATSTTAAAGGAGADGMVVITEFA